MPTCPQPECAVKNHHARKYCSECGARLYPTETQIEGARRDQMKPRLLDLFCGAGGAAMGYHRAGFEVVGVDIEPQPRYPFEFVQTMRWLRSIQVRSTREFDAIHASPPCQAYVAALNRWRGRPATADEHPDLITPLRELLCEPRASLCDRERRRSAAPEPWCSAAPAWARRCTCAVIDCSRLTGRWNPLCRPAAASCQAAKRFPGKRVMSRAAAIGTGSQGRLSRDMLAIHARGGSSEAMGIDWTRARRAPAGDPARLHGADRPPTAPAPEGRRGSPTSKPPASPTKPRPTSERDPLRPRPGHGAARLRLLRVPLELPGHDPHRAPRRPRPDRVALC